MQLASGTHIPDGLLAAMTPLSEKPRQGVTSWESAPHPGIDFRISSTALNFRFRCAETASDPVVAPSSVPTISKVVCTGAAIAGGASAGALIGEGVGGFIGGLVGAGGGTLVAPGVGTVGGGIVGGSAGAGIGAGVGGFIGGLVGGAASNVLCSQGGGSSFGGNQRENKQANDAKNEAERMTGKKFTRAQERVFHDEITGQNYGYHELVQIAVQVLQGVV